MSNNDFLEIKEFVLELRREPGLIGRLVCDGGPWSHCNNAINDKRFPITEGGDTVLVRYKIVPGAKIPGELNPPAISRKCAEGFFKANGLRFPDAAEALSVTAKNHQISLTTPTLVMFIDGKDDTLYVGAEERTPGLIQRRYLFCADSSISFYADRCDFLAVVDEPQTAI